MNLVSLRWFYCPHVLPTPLEQLILKLDFRRPAKPPSLLASFSTDRTSATEMKRFSLVTEHEVPWKEISPPPEPPDKVVMLLPLFISSLSVSTRNISISCTRVEKRIVKGNESSIHYGVEKLEELSIHWIVA
ncbi:hypothetical protein TSUD_138110 [Trifolium subterraneum]|uniref:Uncharacterized protein n=1 Tax=Trifolium subterraneum TaxID=3900 RepID=A0A2Z6PI16_TRISU|nr:hypothetical protein TSUD_138110 [Trifolium subterraneum]